MKSVFGYPGGKSKYAEWIFEKFTAHDVYVEVFGGAAGVLLNKPRSDVEIYNDINDDLVTFFRVLRDRPDELRAYLERVPYSRSEHERIATEWYEDGERPDDPVEHAAELFYLQYTNFNGLIGSKEGFQTSKISRGRPSCSMTSSKYLGGVEGIPEICERFKGVTIECLDWYDLVEKYDSPDTLFYFDPPYLDVGDDYYAHEGEFNHERLVEGLHEIEGHWLLSYTDLPDGLDGYPVVERETNHTMGNKADSEGSYDTERLVMNFDPADEPDFAGADQSNLGTFAGADD